MLRSGSFLVVLSCQVLLGSMGADSFDWKVNEWQVSSEYPPDKEHTWNYGTNLDGWMMAHDGLRGEIQGFREALNSTGDEISKQQAKSIKRWWKGHLIHMHSHHVNEDKIAKSFLEKRFVWPVFMEKDHDQIENYLIRIQSLVSSLGTNHKKERLQVVRLLQKVWEDYMHIVEKHLKEEELVGIHLTRAFYTPKEVQVMTNKLGASGPKVETGAIVNYVGKSRLREAMKAQNVPIFVQKLAWLLILNPRYRYYQNTMLRYLDQIKTTTKKTVEKSSLR